MAFCLLLSRPGKTVTEGDAVKAMLFAIVMMSTWAASAAEVVASRYNSETKSIELELAGNGGCKDHKFQLQVGFCEEGSTLKCDAALVDLSKSDRCEETAKTISISLKDANLTDTYFSRASLSIQGAEDKPAINLNLPEIK